MARQVRRRPMSEINVVPYIDVMLVLLVIFMVTAPMMTQGIKVDLPEAVSAALDVADVDKLLVITIKKDGSLYMNVGGKEERLELELVGKRAGTVLARNPAVQVLIEGDRDLQYGLVVKVMSTLQNAGARSVGLVTAPPEN